MLVIKAYANSATEKYMSEREVHLLCAVRADNHQYLGDISLAARAEKIRLNRATTTSSRGFSNGRREICVNGEVISAGDFILEYVSVMQADVTRFLHKIKDLGDIVATKSDTETISVCVSILWLFLRI